MHYDWPVHRLTLLCFLTAAGGLAPAGCSSDGSNTGDCGVTHEEKTISTPEPAEDPGLQFKIDSCHADVDACPTLCALAMTRAGISFNSGRVIAAIVVLSAGFLLDQFSGDYARVGFWSGTVQCD